MRLIRGIARGLLAAGPVFAVVLGFALSPASSAAATVPLWPTPTELGLPSDQITTATDQSAGIDASTCTSAGNCVVGGQYTDANHDSQAMVATETSRTWGPTIKLTPPLNQTTTTPQNADVYAISCTSQGNCEAAGQYVDTDGSTQIMVANEVNGTWGAASEVSSLPSDQITTAGKQDAYIDGLSCTSPGNCVGVGQYVDDTGATQALVMAETNGTWGNAQKLTVPSDPMSGPQAAGLYALSCTGAGDCVGVGQYLDMNGITQPMVATETNGTWGAGTEVTLPPNPTTTPASNNTYLTSVSCTSTGNCVAGGEYKDTSNNVQGMTVVETNGAWAPAAKVTLPANATQSAGHQYAAVYGISCLQGTGGCVAVGSYEDTRVDPVPMIATESNGSWSAWTESSVPGNISSIYSYWATVSCASPGYCLAGGQFSPSNGGDQAMVANSVAPLSVSSASLPAATMKSAYHAQLAAVGGVGSYTWSLASGSLPAGLSLSSNGTISGTPTSSGSSSFTVRVTDPGPPAQTATGTLSLTVNPPGPVTSVVSFGNQRITLTTPSPVACVSPTSKLTVQLKSAASAHGTNLKFASAAFYIDKGVAHKVHKVIHDKRKLVTVYGANATSHHASGTLALSLSKVAAGNHTLKVVISYKKTVRKHGHKLTVTVTKTLRVKFSVC